MFSGITNCLLSEISTVNFQLQLSNAFQTEIITCSITCSSSGKYHNHMQLWLDLWSSGTYNRWTHRTEGEKASPHATEVKEDKMAAPSHQPSQASFSLPNKDYYPLCPAMFALLFVWHISHRSFCVICVVADKVSLEASYKFDVFAPGLISPCLITLTSWILYPPTCPTWASIMTPMR